MNKEEKQINVFIATDGKEFLSENECIEYENTTLKALKNIRYFKYFTNRDLTETGLFYKHNYAAVYIAGYDDCYREVLLQYLLDKHNGKLLSINVQGYGVTSNFEIAEIDKESYFERKPNKWGGSNVDSEQIFLSEKNVDGFPEAIKVISRKIDLK